MDQTTATNSDEVFSTEIEGLPEASSPGSVRLHDGGHLDMRIGPVRKRLDGAELRMLAYNG